MKLEKHNLKEKFPELKICGAQMRKTISIIIPALDEEKNISSAIRNVLNVVEQYFDDYEIIVFDDYSKDLTGVIIDEFAKNNKKIKVVHNTKTMGFAYNYKKGIALAKNDYIAMIPGDNEISLKSIKDIFDKIGQADIIIPYTVNYNIRPLGRRIISKLFTFFMNLLFALKLKYYNGPVVHKKEVIKSIKINSDSFAFQAEILVKLLKLGYSYIEVEMVLNKRKYGKSKAVTLKNILGVLKTIFYLKFGKI
jgi:glycosyltransferase involved in cell wall biosynthesis